MSGSVLASSPKNKIGHQWHETVTFLLYLIRTYELVHQGQVTDGGSVEQTFEARIGVMAKDSGVGRKLMFRVLTRIVRAAPTPIARVDIARGRDLDDDFGHLSEGAVSNAVNYLLRDKLLAEVAVTNPPGGRPYTGVSLSRDAYLCIGIHVHGRHGRATALTGVLVGLAGNLIATHCVTLAGDASEQDAAAADVVGGAADLVDQLVWQGGGTRDGILGVGVEIGGHVFAGTVITSTNEDWLGVDLANKLEGAIKMPVVLENDVNALAIWETHRHRFRESEQALIAIFREGIGAALVINGRVYRGGHGMAGELGHITVEYPGIHTDTTTLTATPAPTNHNTGDEDIGFDAPCPSPCRRQGHVDCLAPPARICGQLGVSDFDIAALSPAIDPKDGRETSAGGTFSRAGTALGRGIVDLVNIVNPTRLILLVPDALMKPPKASAAAAYLSALESALNDAFSTAAHDARACERRITTRAITDIADLQDTGIDEVDNDPEDVVMARAAAATVIDAFLARAAGKVRPRSPK